MSILIGLTGRALNGSRSVGVKQVGKTTVSDMIRDLPDKQVFTVDIAKPLKSLIHDMYGLDPAEFLCSETKEAELEQFPGWTYRKFCEVFGTEFMSKLGCRTLWMDMAMERVKNLLSPLTGVCVGDREEELALVRFALKSTLPPLPTKTRVVIFTDVRFPAEYKAIKDIGGYIVEVQRQVEPRPDPSHPSDANYPEMRPDAVIDNNGTMDELKARVLDIVESLQ